MSRFAGKVALVTGSSRGYGRQIAMGLASGGAKVVLNSRGSAADGRILARDIVAGGGEAIYVEADIGDENKVRDLAAVVARKYNAIDIIVHNAARGYERSVDETTWPQFEEALRVNTYAIVALARHFRPLFRPGGKFLYVSSIGAERGMPGYSAIGASKAAGEALIRSLALEWAPDVQANTVRPNVIPTFSLRSFTWADDLWKVFEDEAPLGVTSVEELARTALWLCSNESDYVNGQVISVDGGFTTSMRRPGLAVQRRNGSVAKKSEGV